MEKIPVILPKVQWQVTAKHANTLGIHVALHKVTWCMFGCPQNTLIQQQFCVARAMSALQVHHFGGYSKTCYKKLVTHVEIRITCEHSESAREWRIVLYNINIHK